MMPVGTLLVSIVYGGAAAQRQQEATPARLCLTNLHFAHWAQNSPPQ